MSDSSSSAREGAPEAKWMHKALRLAWRGRGRVEPNPMVGCVIVREGALLGEGWHRRFGGDHAEIEALTDCTRRGHDPAGVTVYITLEPCRHQGKTPPCTRALIRAKVARVVMAMEDPFGQVAGRGAAELRAAGIEVVTGICEAQARPLKEAYLKRVRTGMPWVIAKWAQTVDGRIATASGDSRWISNDYSRRRVHRLRGRVDAIVVGIGTVLADDPLLTAREVRTRRIARRVVVDPKLRIPETCALLERSAGKERVDPPVTIAVSSARDAAVVEKRQRLTALGVEVLSLPLLGGDAKTLDLRPLLAHLGKAHAATNVLVEGGARLLGAMFGQGLVDEALVFIAPRVLGDARAVPGVRGLTCERIAEAMSLELRRIRRLGGDVMLDYLVSKR